MDSSEDIFLKASKLYEETRELREMARAAAIVEATGYMNGLGLKIRSNSRG